MLRQAAVVAKVAEISGNLKSTSVKALRHASNVLATGVTLMAGRTNIAPAAAAIREARLAALEEAHQKEQTGVQTQLIELGRKVEKMCIDVARLAEDRAPDTDRRNETVVVSKKITGRLYTLEWQCYRMADRGK